MLTVIVSAAATRLTTLAALKADLAIADTGMDSYLETLIEQHTGSIAAFLGRSLPRESLRQDERATGDDVIVLERRHVVSVSSVSVDGEALAVGDWELDGRLLYRLCHERRARWCGRVSVDYQAGWLLPGEVGRDLPADIERACIELCARSFHARGRDPALRSYEAVDIERYSLSAADSVATRDGLPLDVAERLAPYR
jgi:hypothetical protein